MEQTFTTHTAHLDTSCIVSAIFEEFRLHRQAFNVAHDLFRQQAPVYVSDSTRIEYAQLMKMIANDPALLPAETRRKERLYHCGDIRDIRTERYKYCFSTFDTFLSQFVSAHEMELNPNIIQARQDVMEEFQLDAYDAIYVATALAITVGVLIVIDAHHRRITPTPTMNIVVIR